MKSYRVKRIKDSHWEVQSSYYGIIWVKEGVPFKHRPDAVSFMEYCEQNNKKEQ